jgi:type IX secretion system PorP/SprF family membrane protein
MKNKERIILLIAFLTGSFYPAESQETSYFPCFQSYLPVNPAFTGSGADGALRISYMNFYPGNHYNFHTGYLSYDSYFDILHGGAGFYISNDYLGGIMNDLRGGLSYAYFLQAGRDLFINAGLSASFYHRGYNFGDAVFPDQIDAMGNVSLPSSELIENENTTAFDAGTGFVLIYRNITGSFAVSHLTRPGLGISKEGKEKIDRKYSFSLVGDILTGKEKRFLLRPLASFELQGDFFAAAAGADLSDNTLAANLVFIYNSNKNLNLQAGFSFRKEKLAVYYNYRFNVSSHNTFMPFSLMHQTGIILSLNKVEKRLKFRTINLPVM